MSAFPFDAVIFDMDGVIVDTEYYYLGETAAFAKELGLNLTQEELNGKSVPRISSSCICWSIGLSAPVGGISLARKRWPVGTSGRISVRATIRL
mgnify:FL=1